MTTRYIVPTIYSLIQFYNSFYKHKSTDDPSPVPLVLFDVLYYALCWISWSVEMKRLFGFKTPIYDGIIAYHFQFRAAYYERFNVLWG